MYEPPLDVFPSAIVLNFNLQASSSPSKLKFRFRNLNAFWEASAGFSSFQLTPWGAMGMGEENSTWALLSQGCFAFWYPTDNIRKRHSLKKHQFLLIASARKWSFSYNPPTRSREEDIMTKALNLEWQDTLVTFLHGYIVSCHRYDPGSNLNEDLGHSILPVSDY